MTLLPPHSWSTDPVARARVALSFLAEPGDGALGAMVRERGPVDALAQVSAAQSSNGEHARSLAAWVRRLGSVDVADQQQRALRSEAMLLTPEDDAWPEPLRDLGDHAPLLLWVRGDPALLATAALAVVGARACTGYGEHATGEVVSELRGGVSVVSGGAYGIDAAAHRAALGTGAPTIAVLASGADRVYPAGNASLLAQIAREGAVVSEVPLGSAPTKWRFLARNRVIAALTGATLVVEAGWRSGSLNTAAHAATLGRPLGAVPGPITSPASAGCHRLLREYDAMCVTSGAQALELLGVNPEDSLPVLSPEQNAIYETLRGRTFTVEEIAAKTSQSESAVQAALGLMMLDGRVVRTNNAWRVKD